MSASCRFLQAIFMIGFCQFAQAKISTPLIEPTSPTTVDFIRTRITTAVCDTFTTLGSMDRELVITGNVVAVTVRGSSFDDLALCNFPVRTYLYDIGNLALGNYRLELYRRFALDPNRIDLVGTTNFTVSGVTTPLATQVPAISALGIISLCGLMLLVVFGTRKWA